MSNTGIKLSFIQKLRYGAEAALFFAVIGFFRILGLDGASAAGGFLGREIIYRTGASKRARDNIRAAYPEKTPDEIEAIIREMWDNLGRVAGEYAHLDKLSIHGADPRMSITNLDLVDAAMKKGKGILFISGHFANWETMPFVATQYGVEGGEVYRPLNNPYIDRWMVAQRARNGTKDQIAKGPAGTRRIFSLLRGGKSVFLLVDQKTNEGVPVPFFGRDAMTTPAPAMLALKLGATLLPASNERLKGARFRMTVHPPIDFTPTGDQDRDVLALTAKLTEAIEQCVRYRPSQWLWIHRRWPKPGDKIWSKRAQALAGAGVRAESEGSSLT